MDIGQNIILAMVQGLTEFLPVSSSGHLALISYFFGWKFDLSTDLAFHLGSLGAVVWWAITRMGDLGVLRDLRGANDFAKKIAIAAAPAILAGAALGDRTEFLLSRPEIIASALILFSPILWWAERKTDLSNLPRRSPAEGGAEAGWTNLKMRDAFVIGLWQVLAFIPGISRSGTTAAGGMFQGLSKERSVEFSFLLFIPVIGAAAAAQAFKQIDQIGLMVRLCSPQVSPISLISQITASFIFSLLGLHLFLGLIKKIGFGPIIIYRVLLGLLIFGGLIANGNVIK